jgi:hypothetical protein
MDPKFTISLINNEKEKDKKPFQHYNQVLRENILLEN